LASSGTRTFNLAIDDVIQEAYERLGVSSKGGYDLITARRSLNLLMIKWINQGVNLFTLHLHEVAVNSFNNTTYPTFSLAANEYSDILTASCRNTEATPDQDIEMERISYADWLSYPNKYSTGTPLKFAVDRNAEFNSSGVANHTVYLWPGPNVDNKFKIIMWAIKYGQDITDNYSQNAAIPKRMLPALISGLTVELANKHPKLVDINRRQELIQMYDKEWELAREVGS
jgi:hypothetical protein